MSLQISWTVSEMRPDFCKEIKCEGKNKTMLKTVKLFKQCEEKLRFVKKGLNSAKGSTTRILLREFKLAVPEAHVQ